MGLKILGTGSALPSNMVTNEQLTKMVDTSDEWIASRTGIRQRHISTGETTTELCVRGQAGAGKCRDAGGGAGADRGGDAFR